MGNIHSGIMAGKLNGVMPATTPSGCTSSHKRTWSQGHGNKEMVTRRWRRRPTTSARQGHEPGDTNTCRCTSRGSHSSRP
jgi:hypothetical protein